MVRSGDGAEPTGAAAAAAALTARYAGWVVTLRAAVAEDVPAVARVHVRAWQVGYRGLLPAAYLAQLSPEERGKRYTFGHVDPAVPHTIVAVAADGAIVGFVTTGPATARTEGAGHLMALYIDPARWGQGVGQRLCRAGRERMAACGHDRAVLWCLAGNTRAERFYAADGWVADGPVEQQELWGIVVDDRRYRRALP